MSLPRAVAPLVLALAVLAACSSTPAPATPGPTEQPALVPMGPSAPAADAGLCEQLDAGLVPLQVITSQPGVQADPLGAIRDAIETIREDCPQHAVTADNLQFLLDNQPPPGQDDGQGNEGEGQDDEQDPGEAALQACVEQTGQTEAQCREQAASGGAS